MFVVTTVSVSSTVTKTNIDMVTNSQNEPEHDYHITFITFMKEGLKDNIQYDVLIGLLLSTARIKHGKNQLFKKSKSYLTKG